MTQYDNTNTFVLFINDRKSKDTHPDRTGTLNVDGVEYFIDGWVKDGANGKFMRGVIKRKDKQPETEAPRPSKTHGDRPGGPKNRMNRDEYDDTPF